MAYYDYKPVAFGIYSFATYFSGKCYWDGDNASPLTAGAPYDAIEATVTGLGQRDVGAQPKATTWVLTFELESSDQAELEVMHLVFNPAAGQQYLTVWDGNGVAWKVLARPLGVPVRRSHTIFDVVLRVADPVFQQSIAPTPDTKTNVVTSPQTINITPAGNADAYPTFVVTADVGKAAGAAADYGRSLRGFWVNRAPGDWNNLPIALFDQNGNSFIPGGAAFGTRIDTSTFGQTDGDDIRAWMDYTERKRWLVNPRAAGTEVWVNATAPEAIKLTPETVATPSSPANGGSMSFKEGTGRLPPDGFLAWGSEVWHYTAKAGRSVTGLRRACWGTTAADHALPTPVALTALTKSTVTATGTTAAAHGYVAGQRVSISNVVAASDSDRGYYEGEFLINTVPLATTFTYTMLSVPGANATSGTATPISVFANPTRFLVADDNAAAANPPAPYSERPCLSLGYSTNQKWTWGDDLDTADANQSRFIDPANPFRSAQWRAGMALDGNAIVPLTALFNDGTSRLLFKDDIPGDGSEAANYAEIELPQGIKSRDLLAQLNDRFPAAEILNLERFFRDAAGTWKLIDQYMNAGGLVTLQPLPAALSAPAYAARLKARYAVATGWRADNSTAKAITNATVGIYVDGMMYVLWEHEADTLVDKLHFYMNKQTAGTQTVTVRIASVASNAPADPVIYSASFVVSGTTFAWYTVQLPKGAITRAGQYSVALYNETPFAQTNWAYASGGPLKQPAYQRVGGAWALQNWDHMAFYVTSAYDKAGNAPINSEQPVTIETTNARTGVFALWDKPATIFVNEQYPYVHRNTGFVSAAVAGASYHHVGVFANPLTGESIAVDLWMALGSTLTINCKDRTAIYTEDGIDYNVSSCITPSNPANWMHLIPGYLNAVTWTDASHVGGAQIDLVTNWLGYRR